MRVIDAHHLIALLFEAELELQRLRIDLVVFDALGGDVARAHGFHRHQAPPAHDAANLFGLSRARVFHDRGIDAGRHLHGFGLTHR